MALGVDIGGSGIKAAPVDVLTGRLMTKRERIPTPRHSTPAAVGEVVAQLTARFRWSGAVGCTFPAVIKKGVALSAANVDRSWIGTDVDEVLLEGHRLPRHGHERRRRRRRGRDALGGRARPRTASCS